MQAASGTDIPVKKTAQISSRQTKTCHVQRAKTHNCHEAGHFPILQEANSPDITLPSGVLPRTSSSLVILMTASTVNSVPVPSVPAATAAPTAVDVSALLTTRETLQGVTTDLGQADAATRLDVLEKAFDFRGDVTLVLADGRTVTGYVFDRTKPAAGTNAEAHLATAIVRLLPAEGDQRMTIPYIQIRQIAFGRDTAMGKSFETWIKKYVEKKLKGEKASIESESI